MTASCTRCSARAMSVPNWKLALTSEKPVLEVAFDSSSPGTAWMAVSMGVETSSSTTAGAAPGYCVMTMICGKLIEGISSCLRLLSARAPNSPTTIVTRAMSARLRRLNTESRCTWVSDAVGAVTRRGGRGGARAGTRDRGRASQRLLGIPHAAGMHPPHRGAGCSACATRPCRAVRRRVGRARARRCRATPARGRRWRRACRVRGSRTAGAGSARRRRRGRSAGPPR